MYQKQILQQIEIIIHRYRQLNVTDMFNEIGTENIYEDFSKNKETFNFSDYSTNSKYCHDFKVLVVVEMKNKMGGVAVKEFVV